jgi:hypothetical protein
MYRRHSYNLYYAAFASDRLGKGTSDNRYFVALDWGHSFTCDFSFVAGAAVMMGSVLAMTTLHSSLVPYFVH